MEIFIRCVELGFGALGFVLLIVSLRGMRKESRTSLISPIAGIFSAFILTTTFIIIAGVPLNWLVAILLLGVGFFIGLLEGVFTRIYYRGDLLFAKRSALYFVLWGLAYLMTLLLAQTGSATLTAGGILAMVLSLGIAFGSNLNLLFRQTVMRPAIAMPTTDASPSPVRPLNSPGRAGPPKPASSKPTDLPGQ